MEDTAGTEVANTAIADAADAAVALAVFPTAVVAEAEAGEAGEAYATTFGNVEIADLAQVASFRTMLGSSRECRVSILENVRPGEGLQEEAV